MVYESEDSENMLAEDIVYVLVDGKAVPASIPDDGEVNGVVSDD